jgi:hypothetical protein
VTGSTGPGFESTAWAWVEHLRAGGSTPWLTWADTDHAPPAGRPGTLLPGAAQLEVVRRLAERHARTDAAVDFPGLADLVFARAAPGRGMPRLPLVWPPDQAGGGRRQVGAPPADPARVPTDELIRVAVGAFADLLQRGVRPEPSAPPRPPRRWPWSRQFQLAGAPTTAARARAGFTAAGHPEGGWRPHVVLFVPPFDVLLGQVWSARVQHGAPIRWRTFLGTWAGRSTLPPAADVTAIAARWRERVGADKVHLVTGTADEGWHDLRARRTAALVLGLRTTEPATPVDPRSLPAAGVAVLRLLNRLLSVRAEADQARVLLRRAVSLLGDEEPTGRIGLRVPDQHRAWIEDRARWTIERLRAEDYAVHGDLDQLAPTGSGRVRPPRPKVLDQVLDACLRAAQWAT